LRGKVLKIIKHCKIEGNTVTVDGNKVLETVEQPGSSKQFKEIYTSLGISYPKFYKMDMLSKLAFLASEYLLEGLREKISETDTAVVLFNRHSTIDVDNKYLDSIKSDNYFPNPALFVYTLPNVMIGEISIRNSLKGETVFVQYPCFSGQQTGLLLDSIVFTNCICGMVEYENENNFKAMLAFVERNEKNGNISFDMEFDRLYNNSF
jgi:hypothetical protein